uniref:Dehydrogenase n=1 Tax=Timema cristinae TaxID=61476 RepID=A0A7R9CF87_TIMCR|nr:unnamed protein product [Timema cristinae]
MKEKGVDDGHIIHINSIDGHMPVIFPGLAHYFASKHAVTVLTEGLRRELVQLGSKIKVTSISPGVVDTDMLRSFTDGTQVSADELPALKSEDIANAVTYALGTPPHVQRWSGRVALVTGASAGIGAAIVRELVKNGLIVVGLARRAELIEELSAELKGAPGKLHAFKGDASKEEDILAAFDWIKKNLGRIDVLVNNAAILHMLSLMDENTSQWRQMFDLNVLGLSICTREAFKLMKEKGRWSGRVALVTGASVGIGAAIVRELVKNGLIVVGLARRAELVEELSAELKGAPGKLHALKGDLTKEEDILAAFDWIKKNLGRIDVLVNNAGVLHLSMLTGGETSQWKQIFDLNVIGLSISTREAFKLMKEKGVDDGHIIHINSVAGHSLVNFPGIVPYSASKHAVTVLTEGLRRELVQLGSKIRVTSISPGGVDTDMVKSVTGQSPIPEGEFPLLQAEDIANAVTYVLGTPPHVQRWSGRVALVTGASAGIGAAIVRELVKNGLIVVGLARRAELVELKGAPGKLHALKGDLTKEEDILAAFDWIKKNLGRIDVLVNNAAVLHISTLTGGETSHWKQMFDLNVIGLSICTREVFKLMKEKGVDDGHIIHINRFCLTINIDKKTLCKRNSDTPTPNLRKRKNILNHLPPSPSPQHPNILPTFIILLFSTFVSNPYRSIAPVHLASSLSKSSSDSSQSISPGAVDTDMIKGITGHVPIPEGEFPLLRAEDIANAVTYVLGTPPHVQIHEITIKPIGEKY